MAVAFPGGGRRVIPDETRPCRSSTDHHGVVLLAVVDLGLMVEASRLTDRLVASGLVERVPGRADRREIALSLTPWARTLLAELRTIRRGALVAVLEKMSASGRTALLRGLTEFAAAADENSKPSAATA